MNVESQFLEKIRFLKFKDISLIGIKKFVDNLVAIYMPKIGGVKIISNQSILLKNRTKNCFTKFTKHQEYGVTH